MPRRLKEEIRYAENTFLPLNNSHPFIIIFHIDRNLRLKVVEDWRKKVSLLPPPQALLAFNFIDFDSLRSACQISKSGQKIRGSSQTSTIKVSYEVHVVRP